MKKLSFLLFAGILLFGASFSLVAQNLSGSIFSKSTQEPIPFAEITLGKNYGVISNTEGKFSINTEKATPTDSLKFYSLGYAPKKIAVKDFNDQDAIYLEEKIDELEDVYLIDRSKIIPEELMEKVLENAENNYASAEAKMAVFERYSGTYELKDMEINIKKADFLSRKQQNRFVDVVDSIANASKGKPSEQYSESFYYLYKDKDANFKTQLQKATKLANEKKSKESGKILEKTLNSLTANLDSDKTFKVKSGLFKLQDSLKLKEAIELSTNDSILNENKAKSFEFKQNRETFFSITGFDFIENYKRYKFTLKDVSGYKGEMVYVLGFEPDRGNAKYQGTLYISADTHAVIKMDYALLKGEKAAGMNMKFLFGINYKRDQAKGILIFQKNEEGKYLPKYIKKSARDYVYLDRNILFKENKEVGWFTSKPKMKFNFLIENLNHSTSEFLFIDNQAISQADFEAIKPGKGIKLEKIKAYNPQIWKAYNILAPSKEIEEFEY